MISFCIYYHISVKQHIFLNNPQSKFNMALDLIDEYEYHSPSETSSKNSTHNPSFEIYFYFFILYAKY